MDGLTGSFWETLRRFGSSYVRWELKNVKPGKKLVTSFSLVQPGASSGAIQQISKSQHHLAIGVTPPCSSHAIQIQDNHRRFNHNDERLISPVISSRTS
ncbi:hypothetical protein HanIR_Chr17g0863451 [Helianthus annuus]|nr:hypothetical protein HanIR_Chr17g0863451 [Helianthus annuus]